MEKELMLLKERWSSLTREQKKKVEELASYLDFLNRDMQENKYKYYIPIGRLEAFIKAVGEDKYFITFLSAANGIGKTTTAVVLLAQLFWFSGNVFFNYPLFREWKYRKVGRIASETHTITDTIIPAIREWFPKGRYKLMKAGKRFYSKLVTDNGWEIGFMTYEQDARQFESSTLGLGWLDEPPPLQIWGAMVSRFRLGGKLILTATPLTNAGWLYDRLYTNPRAEFL